MKLQLQAEGEAPDLRERAKSFGLDLTFEEAPYRLLCLDGSLTLIDPERRRLCIDFDDSGPDYRRRSSLGKQELLAKAVGSRQGVSRVLDLSAGLGQDAVFLSQLGFQVTAVERNPLLAFLLNEAKRKTGRAELASLNFLWKEAADVIEDEGFLSSFEAVYFDPMYPSKKKSALPRQEMVLFRDLVGPDEDSLQVVEKLAGRFRGRIVVKRPLEAPPLLTPTHSFEGKTVRYDVMVRSK